MWGGADKAGLKFDHRCMILGNAFSEI